MQRSGANNLSIMIFVQILMLFIYLFKQSIDINQNDFERIFKKISIGNIHQNTIQ